MSSAMTNEPSIVTKMRMSMEVKGTAYCNYRVLIAETGEGGEGDLQLTVLTKDDTIRPSFLQQIESGVKAISVLP
ncbi:hypothetical protein DQG23_16410 [Paenibacillus contaminans]|uniref:Uncharacterized protein n=2 Tax=Paenibacillus contaminans TaxID=450362 RepID=A0A329ML76_9BACL|nr:hypothetical protein DQG23_16410 [Paenibacillus contaminans]